MMIARVLDKISKLVIYTVVFIQWMIRNLYKEILRNVHEEISMVT